MAKAGVISKHGEKQLLLKGWEEHGVARPFDGYTREIAEANEMQSITVWLAGFTECILWSYPVLVGDIGWSGSKTY